MLTLKYKTQFQINNLTLHLKELGKGEQTRLKISKMKEIIVHKMLKNREQKKQPAL